MKTFKKYGHSGEEPDGFGHRFRHEEIEARPSDVVVPKRNLLEVCLVGSILLAGAGALYSQKPALKEGISVEMPVAGHAVEMRAADEQNATVVAMTADGRVFVGIEPTEPAALSRLTERTVYVKADVQAPYQKVLAVVDAFRGKSVVLLSAPPENAVRRGYVPPYGTKLIVSR